MAAFRLVESLMTRFGWGSLGGKNKLPNFMDMINLAGASSALQVCLDPADINSYDASARYLQDLSGNANDFGDYPVSPSSADGKTPAPGTLDFNGTLGGLTDQEYVTGEVLLGKMVGHLSAAPIYTFADNFTVVGAQFTIAMMFYIPSSPANTTSTALFATMRYDLRPLKGMAFVRVGDDGKLQPGGKSKTAKNLYLLGSKGADQTIGENTSGLSVPNDQWVFCAVSLDSLAGTVHFRSNGSTVTNAITWGGGTAGNGGNGSPYRFDDRLSGDGTVAPGRRVGPMAIWNRALSNIEIANIYNKLKLYRYTDLP